MNFTNTRDGAASAAPAHAQRRRATRLLEHRSLRYWTFAACMVVVALVVMGLIGGFVLVFGDNIHSLFTPVAVGFGPR